MIIKMKKRRWNRNGISRFDVLGEYIAQMELEVLAIMRNYGRVVYLVRFSVPGTDNALDWVAAKNFVVLSDQKPATWVEHRWSALRPHIKRNSNFPDFDFRITYFCGPAALLESDIFLFESIENPEKAIGFLQRQRQ